MLRLTLTYIFLFAAMALFSQEQPVQILQQNFKIPGKPNILERELGNPAENPTFYFALETGDELIFNIQGNQKSGMNQLFLHRYPDYNVPVLKNETWLNLQDYRFRVNQRGVYRLSFSTLNPADRDCQMTVHRVPANAAARNFDTNIRWKTVSDTTFAPIGAVQLLKPQTVWVEARDKKAPTANLAVLAIELPQGTQNWFVIAGGNRDRNDVSNNLARYNLQPSLNEVLGKRPGAEINLDAVNAPPGVDNFDIFLLDEAGREQFAKGGNTFTSKPEGSREGVSSLKLKINTVTSGTCYLGIRNPGGKAIGVNIEAVAIARAGGRGVPVKITEKQVPLMAGEF